MDSGRSWGAPAAKVLPKGTFAANPSAAWHPGLKTVTLVYDNTVDECIYTSTSSDLGLTFSAPAPALFANGSQVKAYAGPGNSIVVLPKTGWIAFAGYAHWRNYSTAQPTFWSNVYLSRDGGKTWVRDPPPKPGDITPAHLS